ncbi:hypothetical protein [Tropicibacter naphthalenivorans]|uniref:Uncharacterized protein n=1 Tax=Tropicibacter naphthalenivorans TaxID=441103 RepID=A0A0N7LZ15_9RHOB|nr:hypothetical protein [Tropicibacter naphthalenivorans]CUH76401.1 hypothetical protein TRN7648_00916 [Tropicibacter naphthalenivorans]SMC66298.1 hypothetical protein SAMN04488093_102703 [Tropicibacter naphthalenivorans]
MFKKIFEIGFYSTLVLGFTAGAVASMDRNELYQLSAHVINYSGFDCPEVLRVAPTEADEMYKVKCSQGATYIIDTLTGGVWKA